MDLTFGQIYLELSRRCNMETNIPADFRHSIKRLKVISSPKEMLDPEVLYVSLTQARAEVMDGFYMRPRNMNDPIAFLNLIEGVFSFLYEVLNHLQVTTIQKQNYRQMLQYVEQTLGLALLLVDKNLHYLAETPGYRRINYDWMGDYEDITIEWINALQQDEEFMKAINHQEAFIYKLSEDTISNENVISYCYNVRVNGNYEARLLLQNMNQCTFEGGLDWVDTIGNLIAIIFNMNYDQISQTSEAVRFYELIQLLAEDQPVNPEEVKLIISGFDWEPTDRYQVYLFQSQQRENETVNLRFYQTAIQNLMNECCVFRSDRKICCVRNLTRTSPIYQNIRQQLSEFLRDNLFLVGISNEFSDLLQLKYYYKEAQQALIIGKEENSTHWSYNFNGNELTYLVRLMKQTLPEEEWIHPAIRILGDYDQREGTELVRTVFEYMKNQYNITRTAQALFIHRTTLLFRLDRIKILTELDWTSMADKALLYLTYMIMGEKEVVQ